MNTRSIEMTVRAAPDTTGGEVTGRTFTGIGVPYGQTIDLGAGVRERFEPGAINLEESETPPLVLWRHDEPIGKITGGADTSDGFEITGVLSDTERGREAATLLRDGVITRLSIGFQPQEYKTERDEDAETIVHTRVRALEFSLVPFPAYSAAAITDVRANHPSNSKDTTMTTTPTALTRSDLEPLEDAVEDLERRLSLTETNHAAAPGAPVFRSAGDMLKRVASGDDEAMEAYRAFNGETTAQAIKTETYLGEYIKFVQDRRRLINLFDRGQLPAKGMSVEYARLATNTLTAGKQNNEGDNLAGPGRLTLSTESARVTTYGGWTELSRQFIERAELPHLDTIMTALGLEYAKATNAAMREEIKKVITAQNSQAIQLAGGTVYDWRDAIVDASARYEENGFTIKGLLVATDVFKKLQRLEYTNVPALTVRPGDEFSGTLNLPGGEGDLARVPVYCIHGEVPAGTAAFFDSVAIKTLESTNAPLQLQDDNIINLSRAFSVYGYLSVITPFPTAIVPVKPKA